MSGGVDPIQKHAEFLANNISVPNVSNVVLLILYDLSIPVNCVGFRYLKDVLPNTLQNTSHIVESELFDSVGSRYVPAVSTQNMASAVHNVLQKAWSMHTYSRWRKYVPEYIMERSNAPSNLEFISCIAYFLEFWLNCYEKGDGHERT